MIPVPFFLIPSLFRWFVYTGLGPSFHPLIESDFPSGLDALALGILLAGMESRKCMPKSFQVWGNLGFLQILLKMIARAAEAFYANGSIFSELISWRVMLSAGFIVCYVANPNAPVAKWLCAPLLRWFGFISYELYLLHQLIILWERNALAPCHKSSLRYMAMLSSLLPISVLAACIVYRYNSLPKLLISWSNRPS